MNQQGLNNLETHFKEREINSIRRSYSNEEILAVRLDGFRVTGTQLRNQFINNKFHKAFEQAIQSVYISFAHFPRKSIENTFVCAISFSDEVTFILNNKKEIFNNRLQKITSLFCGALSAFMTKSYFDKPDDKFKTIVFDSRPIIFDDKMEMFNYIRYRYYINRRYGLSRSIRFNSERKTIGDEIYSDLDKLSRLARKLNVYSQYLKLETTYKLYVPFEGNKFFKITPFNSEFIVKKEFQKKVSQNIH